MSSGNLLLYGALNTSHFNDFKLWYFDILILWYFGDISFHALNLRIDRISRICCFDPFTFCIALYLSLFLRKSVQKEYQKNKMKWVIKQRQNLTQNNLANLINSFIYCHFVECDPKIPQGLLISQYLSIFVWSQSTHD